MSLVAQVSEVFYGHLLQMLDVVAYFCLTFDAHSVVQTIRGSDDDVYQ